MKPSEKKVWKALWLHDEGLTFTKLLEITKLSTRGLTMALQSLVDKVLIVQDPATKIYSITDPKNLTFLKAAAPPSWVEYDLLEGSELDKANRQFFKYEAAYNYVIGSTVSYMEDDDKRKKELSDMLRHSLNYVHFWGTWYLGNMFTAVREFVEMNELTERIDEEELNEAIEESIKHCEKMMKKNIKEMFLPLLESTSYYLFWNWDLVDELDREYRKMCKKIKGLEP